MDFSQPSLLIVDDDEFIFDALSRSLRGEGYRLVYAPSAEHGLNALAVDRFDVVVSDNRMPGMNGLEFLELVQVRHPGTVRVMISADASAGALINAFQRGTIFRLLSKPWSTDELKSTVRFALQHWQELAVETRLASAAPP